MSNLPLVLFVCEHGSAKSVIAATYFNKLAAQNGLSLRAVSRGTTPDETLSANTVMGLANDGLIPSESSPQKLSPDDMGSAQMVISFCDLSGEGYQRDISIEQWNDVPPVSQNYELARDVILSHLNRLMENIKTQDRE